MEFDTVIFFETPNFPQIRTDEEMKQCYINFTRAFITEEKNKKFVIEITNSICDGNHFCNDPYVIEKTNFTSYFFYLHNPFSSFYYTAFQGFAYIDNWGDDCPLESVSRVKPFEFSDLTEILTIRSTYDTKILGKQSCLWQFKAPRNYGFKIVITGLKIAGNTIFKIENSEEVIITPANVKIKHPHYIIDNYLKIYLSKNDKPYLPTENGENVPEFTAYVTLIQDYFNDVPIECDVQVDGNFTVWSYLKNSGYPNNARCTYTLTIFPNTEVIASQTKTNYEDKVDTINYYYDSNSLPNIYGKFEDHKTLVFSADGNKERKILWEFISDGSVQSHGFEIHFETKYCLCVNSLIIVPCSKDEVSTNLMNNNTNKIGEDFYCGNLKCNFTIKLDPECKSQFISLNFYEVRDDTEEESFNVYRLISNNTIISEIIHSIGDVELHKNMISENHNIFEIITTLSSYSRSITLYLQAINISGNLPAVIINESKPYYFYNLCVDKCKYRMPIELSANLKQQNATIDIYIFDAYYFTTQFFAFYNNNNLFDQIDFLNCLVMITPRVYRCRTNMSLLAFIQFDYSHIYNSYLLFQVSYGENHFNPNGCIFKNNVFNFMDDDSLLPTTTAISAMSNEKKSCKIFIYAPLHFYIKELWTSPNVEGEINIYSGGKEKLFASIDIKSTLLWHDLYLSENIYLIEIPLTSTIMITYNSTYPLSYITNITNDPYKTVITLPYYGHQANIEFRSNGCEDDPFRIFNIQDAEVQFTILDYDILEPNFFYFLKDKNQINVTSTLQSIIFKSSHLELYCSCNDEDLPCSLRIMVETVHPNETFSTLVNTKTFSISTTTPLKMTTTAAAEQESHSFTSTVKLSILFLQGLTSILLFYDNN